MNKGVKVNIDYSSGYCIITGLIGDSINTLKVPIRGFDIEGNYVSGYSRKNSSVTKREIRSRIGLFFNRNANFKYSDKAINNVDPIVYGALKEWDNINDTEYSLQYLKTIVEDCEDKIEEEDNFKENSRKNKWIHKRKS